MSKHGNPVDWFLQKVEMTRQCWIWCGGISPNGYGTFRWNGKTTRVNRVAWEIFNGEPPPSDMMVCHCCDNPRCVRPDHLFLGTGSDNQRDCISKGRRTLPVLRGESNRRAILTEDQVRTIKSVREWRYGDQCKVARALGVNKGTISAIIKGNRWRHVSPSMYTVVHHPLV